MKYLFILNPLISLFLFGVFMEYDRMIIIIPSLNYLSFQFFHNYLKNQKKLRLINVIVNCLFFAFVLYFLIVRQYLIVR
jgi:hypothetical protein